MYHAIHVALFPYDLVHAFEGNNLYSAWRVSHGKSPYTDDLGRIGPGYPYTPLYFLESAIGVRLFGVDIRVVRLTSLLNIAISAWIIYKLARRHEWMRSDAVLLVSSFLTWTVWSTGSSSIGIADQLVMMLSLVAIHFAVEAAERGASVGAFVAGMTAALPPMAKQTALALPFCIVAYYVIYKRKLAPPYILGIAVAFASFFAAEWYAWGPEALTHPWLDPAHDPKLRRNLPVRILEISRCYMPFILACGWLLTQKGWIWLRTPHAFLVITLFVCLIPSQIGLDPAPYYFAPWVAAVFLLWIEAYSTFRRSVGWRALVVVYPFVALMMQPLFPRAPMEGDFANGRALTSVLSEHAGKPVLTDRHVSWALSHNGDVAYDFAKLFNQAQRGVDPDPWGPATTDVAARRFSVILTSSLYERDSLKDAINDNYEEVRVIQSDTTCRYKYKFRIMVPREQL